VVSSFHRCIPPEDEDKVRRCDAAAPTRPLGASAAPGGLQSPALTQSGLNQSAGATAVALMGGRQHFWARAHDGLPVAELARRTAFAIPSTFDVPEGKREPRTAPRREGVLRKTYRHSGGEEPCGDNMGTPDHRREHRFQPGDHWRLRSSLPRVSICRAKEAASLRPALIPFA
jgi:hypothetical protein